MFIKHKSQLAINRIKLFVDIKDSFIVFQKNYKRY